jgi:Lon protease-like protein
MASPFDPIFEDLPRVIPIFPLPGALLLPHGRLPLNIFEPRYLNMTLAALAADERMIGMIQPEADGEPPPIYRTGCAGRLTSFSETEDGRFLITLAGLCRFDVVDELPLLDGYRRVVADYHRYRDDMAVVDDQGIDRERLLAALRGYLEIQGVEANWEAVEQADGASLVTSLAMTCPFQVSEKQALLEAADVTQRAEIMVALLEMAVLAKGDEGGQTRQ